MIRTYGITSLEEMACVAVEGFGAFSLCMFFFFIEGGGDLEKKIFSGF